MNANVPAASTRHAEEYPFRGSDEDKLRFLIGYAVLAPSSHNIQPWLFSLQEGALALRLDRSRALPVADPEGRELTISCGAALFHLRIAARHFGVEPIVERFPAPDEPDLLARVRLGSEHEPTPDEEALFAAIPERRTNRRAFESRVPPEALLTALVEAAVEEGTWLHLVEDAEERAAVADLVAEGDRLQMSDPAFRRELAEWIHPRRSATQDGMSGYAFGLPKLLDFATPAFAMVIRRFDVGEGQAAKDHQLAEGSPVLTVLGTDTDTPETWLAAGEALAHLLLRAHAAGVQASYLNQPIQVAALRPRLRDAIGMSGFPQLLLRLGYGTAIEPAPRRGPAAVLR